MNQAEACKVLGLPLDQAPTSHWERGKALPRRNRLRAILAIIDKPLPVESPKLRFAEALRDWRKRRGLKQYEAARILGLGSDQGKISLWERGKQIPRPAALSRLLAITTEDAR